MPTLDASPLDAATLDESRVIRIRHGDLEEQLLQAYYDGYVACERDIAESIAEVRAVALAAGQRLYEQRVADRIAQSEAAAERFHREHGTHPWVIT